MTVGAKRLVGTVALAGAGAAMAIVGALHLVAPQMMMDAPGIQLTTVNHLHIVRAAYGGAFLGMAALFLLGLTSDRRRASSLLALAVLYGGFALGRLVGIAVDGLPHPRYFGVLSFEAIFAVLALVALRAERPAAGR